VFLTSDGTEIDRIVGYLPPDSFLKEMRRIRQGEGTYLSLKKAVKAHPNNVDTLVQFAKKVGTKSGYSARSLELWERVDSLSTDGEDIDLYAQMKVAEHRAVRSTNPAPLESYLTQYPDQSHNREARFSLLRLYRENGTSRKEAELYTEIIRDAEEQGQLSASMLNGYAWRMAELELRMDAALQRATQAVRMTEGSDPETRAQILDTRAEILWKLGRTEEAVEIIDKCISLQPDDDYYRKQKRKFANQDQD